MFTLRHRKPALKALAFSPDGSRLAAIAPRGPVQVWDLASRSLAIEIDRGGGLNETVFFGSDIVVRGLSDLQAYDAATGRSLGVRPPASEGLVAQASVSWNRAAVVAETILALHAFPSWKLLWSRKLPLEDAGFVALACAGDIVAVGTDLGEVAIHGEAGDGPRETFRLGRRSLIRSVALSPDGKRCAFSTGTELRLLRIGPLEGVAVQRLGRAHFQTVAWHPSGEFFATANGDGKSDLWDAATGERRESFDWGTGKLHGIAFDATGDRAAVCAESGQIVVWDVDR